MRAKLIDGCGFALQPAPTVVTLSDFVASPLACAQAAHPRAPADFHSARSKCATSRREMRKSWKRLASDPLDARSSAIDYQGTMAGLPSVVRAMESETGLEPGGGGRMLERLYRATTAVYI